MATIGEQFMTLQDVAAQTNNGKIQTVVNLLMEQNEMLLDMPWQEANNGTSNITSVLTGLPGVTWRKLYQGVAQTKATRKQVSDACGMLEARSEVDVDLLDMSGDRNKVRMNEDSAFIEAMSQELSATLIYGDTDVDPEKFMGLDQRYNVLSTDTTLSGYNVFDAGAGDDTDNTSIWLIGWGPNTCYGIYPQGTTAGLTHQNLGQQTVLDGSSNPYEAEVSLYKQKAGLVVRDWRSIARIANVDVTNLEAETSAPDLIKLMIRAQERIRGANMRPVWYMHERVKTFLRIQKTDHASINSVFDTVEGKEVMTFGGLPVRKVDQILLTEADIT